MNAPGTRGKWELLAEVRSAGLFEGFALLSGNESGQTIRGRGTLNVSEGKLTGIKWQQR